MLRASASRPERKPINIYIHTYGCTYAWERAGDETKDVIRMADMKENNMNDGVPSLDETAAEAVRLSVGPRPGAGPEKPRKDRRRIIIGAAAVAVAVLVAGGVCAHRAYESHQASVARDACESAVADQAKAVKAYKTLLGSDATVAALKTDAKSVKDAKTVDTLKRAAAVRLPAMVKCDASKAADLDAAAAKANKAARTVKSDTKALETAAKAVESSKLDKTVADADALYKATDGKVQDDKTRDALKQAIAKRDAAAIAKAVKSVNDSKTAKEKADAEAKAKAEQEAAAAAAAAVAAQQAQASQSQTYSGGGSYSNRGYSYSGASSGGSTSSPAQSNGSGGSSAGSGSGLHIVIGGSGVPAQNGQCRPGNTCMDGVCNTCP